MIIFVFLGVVILVVSFVLALVSLLREQKVPEASPDVSDEGSKHLTDVQSIQGAVGVGGMVSGQAVEGETTKTVSRDTWFDELQKKIDAESLKEDKLNVSESKEDALFGKQDVQSFVGSNGTQNGSDLLRTDEDEENGQKVSAALSDTIPNRTDTLRGGFKLEDLKGRKSYKGDL